ncbi:MAG: TIGR00159 family protein [Candidatus Omnitrophica bacterium]|nr:TIGR00159 family protein [Candidatus Omnitrophota bacterium]
MHTLVLWKSVLEIGFIWVLLYFLLRFLQGTRAVQVLTGLIILVILFNVAKILELSTINWVLTKLFAVGVLAFLILFQPELRRGLARIGQNTIFNPFLKKGGTVDEAVEACQRMSKMKRGALIAIEREAGLRNYIESGIPLDAKISSELLMTIFATNTPTHDGAVIIEGDRIASAGSLLPLSQNPSLPRQLGTRHRAAIGLTEETDAVCVVVSEETGAISVSVYGKLTRDLDEEGLKRVLKSLFRPEERGKEFLNYVQQRFRFTNFGRREGEVKS